MPRKDTNNFTHHVQANPMIRRLYLHRRDPHGEMGDWSPKEIQDLIEFDVWEYGEEMKQEALADWSYCEGAGEWWAQQVDGKKRFSEAGKRARFWKNRCGYMQRAWLGRISAALGEEAFGGWEHSDPPSPSAAKKEPDLEGFINMRTGILRERAEWLARTLYFYAALPGGADRNELMVKPNGLRLLSEIDQALRTNQGRRLIQVWVETFG